MLNAKYRTKDTSLPYPKLHIYAHSLLDGKNIIDLEDLVDGMNLSMELGEQNLQLDGSTDVESRDGELRRWRSLRNPHSGPNPESRRDTWETTVRDENEKKPQSLKVRDNWLTPFWREGQNDPRLLGRK